MVCFGKAPNWKTVLINCVDSMARYMLVEFMVLISELN
jgi:hypothetical protein